MFKKAADTQALLFLSQKHYNNMPTAITTAQKLCLNWKTGKWTNAADTSTRRF